MVQGLPRPAPQAPLLLHVPFGAEHGDGAARGGGPASRLQALN